MVVLGFVILYCLALLASAPIFGESGRAPQQIFVRVGTQQQESPSTLPILSPQVAFLLAAASPSPLASASTAFLTTPAPTATTPTSPLIHACAKGLGDKATLTLHCPEGTELDHSGAGIAFYGTPGGSCGNWTVGDCNVDVMRYVLQNCPRGSSCTLTPRGGLWVRYHGDKCPGTDKWTVLQLACMPPNTSPTVTPTPSKIRKRPPAADRLAAILSDPLYDCTPTWKQTVADYSVFHKDAIRRLRENDNPPKVIVYQCLESSKDTLDACGGFADRILGVQHLFVTALLLKAAFFVDWATIDILQRDNWQVFPQTPRVSVLDTVSSSPFFNITYDYSVVFGSWNRTWEFTDRMGCAVPRPCPLEVVPLETFFPSDVNFVRTNRAPFGTHVTPAVRTAMIHSLGLSPTTAGGCLLHTLLHPLQGLVDEARLLALEILNPQRPHVSLHVRTDDRVIHGVMNRSSDMGSLGDVYWQCVATVIADVTAEWEARGVTLRPRVFFSTDDLAYKRSALSKMGSDAVLIYDAKPWHTSNRVWKRKSGEDELLLPSAAFRLRITFIEWWLMSLCEYFVMGGLSGFSRTAMSYSQAKRGHTVLNYEGRGWNNRGCTRTHPVTRDEIVLIGR